MFFKLSYSKHAETKNEQILLRWLFMTAYSDLMFQFINIYFIEQQINTLFQRTSLKKMKQMMWQVLDMTSRAMCIVYVYTTITRRITKKPFRLRKQVSFDIYFILCLKNNLTLNIFIFHWILWRCHTRMNIMNMMNIKYNNNLK